MCGIVGYIGNKEAAPILLHGLKKLEYRGYDSAGLAVMEGGCITVRRAAGKLHNLSDLVVSQPISGKVGIGHTRWATHGEPNERNAHPHSGMNRRVVVVHNGIVENFLELSEELRSQGIEFHSDTDSETIALLIERFLAAGYELVEAVRRTLVEIKGAHGIVAMSADEPDKIVAARIGYAGGVVIGFGGDEMYVASDVTAILEYTHTFCFLDSCQMAVISQNGVEVQTIAGKPVKIQPQEVAWDPVSAEKGGYRHFMQKEIHEQVRSVTDTLAGRIDFEVGKVRLPHLNLTDDFAASIQKIFITACGTAAHAGMVGKILIENIARIPVELDIASEFRYRDPIIPHGTVVLAISQSGETADTLAAMELGRRKGAKVWSIVNAIGSQAMRLADGYISMQVGPEIGVASTKAFTAPLLDLYLLAVLLADLRGSISNNDRIKLIANLRFVPDMVGRLLDREPDVLCVAQNIKNFRDALYLGRGINMPIAYEGALKLKEISYIHAEAYPAGEMKHGPIALIDREMPVILIAPKDPWYEKMISQVEQVKARGGNPIVVATDGDERMKGLADQILWVPDISWLLSPVMTVIPLQLLAYHIAALKGLDVDQPRNLAKSVTVE